MWDSVTLHAGCEVADEAALCRAHRDAGTVASLRGEIHFQSSTPDP